MKSGRWQPLWTAIEKISSVSIGELTYDFHKGFFRLSVQFTRTRKTTNVFGRNCDELNYGGSDPDAYSENLLKINPGALSVLKTVV